MQSKTIESTAWLMMALKKHTPWCSKDQETSSNGEPKDLQRLATALLESAVMVNSSNQLHLLASPDLSFHAEEFQVMSQQSSFCQNLLWQRKEVLSSLNLNQNGE